MQICIFDFQLICNYEKYDKIPAHCDDVFDVLLLGSMVWPNE